MPNTGANAYPSRYRWLGLLGSLALAAGALTSGALPAAATGPTLRASGGAGTVLVFAGLTVLTAAWLLLGRSADAPPADALPAEALSVGALPAEAPSVGAPPGNGLPAAGRFAARTRWLTATLAWWAAPLLLLPPLFSRDAYSYLAQGAMLAGGFDVYADGPAALGGPIAQQIPQVWQHTPAPYGPAFLLLARAAAPLADHPYAGVLLLRLAAVLAVAALAALLPALARALGTDPAAALRLGALNPLVLLHLVAGAHNDAAPLALMLAGLLAATRRRPLPAAALITLAALTKAPAALALPAAWWLATAVPSPDGPPRSDATPARGHRFRCAAAVLAVAAGTTAVVTAVAGTGYGWVSALTTPATASSWSPSSGLGRLAAALAGVAPEGPVAGARLLGAGVAMALVVLLAVRVARRGSGPVAALALAFGAVVALGPAFRPWYALWCAVPAALAARTAGARRAVELACAALAFAVMPDGFEPDSAELVLAAGGLVLGAVAVMLTERQLTFQERQPAC
ncbi:polyprenol phosphomannose-dependent alpha 1,6 mannosyltransferase MptB [Kitasatospora cineracea]|uniref:Alpha-1,6-mannosyltransferase n=1 Tax=Kitasatospora cineracea TaxID=88074 RepID=A0A8G1X942_9ACTN|nr:polyprenol phosphomannose-dependent alpha 1,6 mannosyltransferase MptB [Kitasatospora cineracea]ROR33938.1 alpha-1,6-mannosyltransferase [Kitasatospora cineracea]